jgi:hypothetical protein
MTTPFESFRVFISRRPIDVDEEIASLVIAFERARTNHARAVAEDDHTLASRIAWQEAARALAEAVSRRVVGTATLTIG